jgi:hypothetical protein
VVWGKKTKVDFDSLYAPTIARKNLIYTKRASGRSQDLIDAEMLSKGDSL